MEGINFSDLVPRVEEPEITSCATTGPGPAVPTAFNGSGGRDGSAASYAWSLTYEQQVQNLKENWRRHLYLTGRRFESLNNYEIIPYFSIVVAKLRVNPFLDSCELESDLLPRGPLLWGARMSSLELAILMGDLKMVKAILHSNSVPHNVIYGQKQDLVSPEFLIKLAPSSDTFKETRILYTPLHLAVTGGDSDIVDAILEEGVDVNAPNWLSQTPLALACMNGNVTMLKQLLEKDNEGKDPLHVAVRYGDVDFMKKLQPLNVNAVDCNKKRPLHYLATKQFIREGVLTDILQYLAQDKALDMKALDKYKLSAFYVAVLCCNMEFVIALLDSFDDQIKVNEACDKDLGPPIQIAIEGGEKFKNIKRALMECYHIKDYMEMLYKDRQVYVDATNAILVGATLIASVTFASWLQPPLSYTSSFGDGYSSSISTPSTSNLNYVDVEHNIALRAFWVFNALSFYFATGTIVYGAQSVLPRRHSFIIKIVEKLRTNLLVTSILLSLSVLFVIIAFGIAGTIVLTPLLKYQWCMIAPTIVGGMVCLISLVFLVKNMVKNHFNIYDDNERLKQKERDYLKTRGYIASPLKFDNVIKKSNKRSKGGKKLLKGWKKNKL